MTQVPLKCRCGAVQGTAHNVSSKNGTRLVCYCSDCQAFARHLGKEEEVLDANGGTDIFQLTPAQVEITQGAEQLRCLRVTEKGVHRWYTDCCKTLIGNTANAKLPFVGLIHTFFDMESMDDKGVRDQHLGPVRFHVQGQHAIGHPNVDKLHAAFPPRLIGRTIRKMFVDRLRGKNRPTPFYDEAGKPVAAPKLVNVQLDSRG